MRISMLVLVLAALLQSTPPPLRTVGKGPMSAIVMARQVTVRSAADWAALWKSNGAKEPVPVVDFSREMVVGVFLGSRPTAGYGVEIIRAVGNSGALLVEYVETAPSRDTVTAQILTAPYHLAAIPKHDGMITFRKVDK
jgi:protease stability complex PrcB-like protein